MAILELNNGVLRVGINTKGAELTFVTGANGTEFLWNGDPDVWSGRAPILFPICGGLKEDTYYYAGKKYNLPKHGFARRSEFVGKKLSDTVAEFVLESNESTLQVYPFQFRLTVRFALNGNEIGVTNTVENLTDGEAYFSIGAHEAYACPEGIEEYEVRFDGKQTLDHWELDGNLLGNSCVRVLENADTLPLKKVYFAIDALVFKNVTFSKATLAHKTSGKAITLSFDGAKYFLIWTKPNGNYICLEPWHGIQDIVGSSYELNEKEGIIRLEKGASYEAKHTISFQEPAL